MNLWRKNFNAPQRNGTPYDKAQEEWDARIGSARVQAANWRFAFFGLLVLATAPSIVGNIYQAGQPKMVPHIIEVKDNNEVVYRGRVGQSWQDYTPQEGVIQDMLERFVEDTRLVSPDKKLQRSNWENAFYFTSNKASEMLAAAYEDLTNRTSMDKSSVYADVKSVQRQSQSDKTWIVDWQEETFSESGKRIKSEHWRGSFQIGSLPPMSEEQIKRNPLGIFIQEFYITKVK